MKKASKRAAREELEAPAATQALLLVDPEVTPCPLLRLLAPHPALAPLGGETLLSRALAILFAAGATEVTAAVEDPTPELVAALEDEKWRHMHVRVMKLGKGCSGVVDAIRTLHDSRGHEASGDYIVLRTGAVAADPDAAGAALHDALRAHRARHARDRSAIVTTVLAKHPDPAADKETCRCVVALQEKKIAYLDTNGRKPGEDDVDGCRLRRKLADSGAMVIAEEMFSAVLGEFCDCRGCMDLVRSVSEHPAFSAHAHIATGLWAAVVSDFSSYLRLSMGLLAQAGTEKIVGEASTVEDGAQLTASVLGKNCLVKAGARIESSILWDGVTVATGAVVEGSVICGSCKIADGVTVGRGCLICGQVVLGKGAVLPPGSVAVHPEFKVPEDIDAKLEDLDVGDGGIGKRFVANEPAESSGDESSDSEVCSE